jgi:tetratricopeptide (TPR) repeat protein
LPSALEPDTHFRAARQLRQLGQLEEALVALRRCLYLDPSHREALVLRAELSGALGRHEEAEQLRRRLARSPRQEP